MGDPATLERGAAPGLHEAAERPPRSPGPLLAVCGLCGGAGASTLAYLVAHAAAREAERPILLCDTGGPTGGLAAYAGVESPRSLAGCADALAHDAALSEGLYANAGDGLRVIARRPEFNGDDGDRDALARLLGDARGAHSLTVGDCATLGRAAERAVLAGASHVAWVLPATASGVRRARRALELLVREPARHELVVARRDAAGRPPPTAELSSLAAGRGAPLVLMPQVPDLAEGSVEDACEAAALTLQAIRGVLAR